MNTKIRQLLNTNVASHGVRASQILPQVSELNVVDATKGILSISLPKEDLFGTRFYTLNENQLTLDKEYVYNRGNSFSGNGRFSFGTFSGLPGVDSEELVAVDLLSGNVHGTFELSNALKKLGPDIVEASDDGRLVVMQIEDRQQWLFQLGADRKYHWVAYVDTKADFPEYANYGSRFLLSGKGFRFSSPYLTKDGTRLIARGESSGEVAKAFSIAKLIERGTESSELSKLGQKTDE